jgi:UDP-N-acetylmuramoyl-L-alanyl-D-glutamate--2,6-diaminopimelate ligase
MADLVEEGCTHAVLEVSSQAMITNRVDDVKFDIAGFTNFSEDHISKYEHHSLDEYFDAKVSLLTKVPKVVINWDDEKVRECYSLFTNKEIHDTGIIKESENINETHLPYVYVRQEEIILTEKKTRYMANISGEKQEITLKLPGKFNIYNSLMAIAVANILGIDKEYIVQGLSDTKVLRKVRTSTK